MSLPSPGSSSGSLHPFAGADPFHGRVPGRAEVLAFLDHLLGPHGPGRLPSTGEWPTGVALIADRTPAVLDAAVRSIALLADGRHVPQIWGKAMPSTFGPVAWCEGPTWAIIGSPDGQIIAVVDNRPGICFDLTGDTETTAVISALIGTLVHERERVMEMEPLTRPALRGLPPLTA